MQPWEWIAAGYFAYSGLIAARARSRSATAAVLATSAASIGVIVALSAVEQTWIIANARLWLPAAWIVIGYWLSGAFFRAPMPRWEDRLRQIERRYLIDPGWLAAADRLPAAAIELLELMYVSCPLLVPLTFAAIAWGDPVITTHYWSSVLLSQFVAFGTLPWIQTRPPRVIEPRRRRGAVEASISAFAVRTTHIGANTVPSGHASVTVAIALLALDTDVRLTIGLGVIAVLVIAGAVVGRYHFLADLIAGTVLAVAAVMATGI